MHFSRYETWLKRSKAHVETGREPDPTEAGGEKTNWTKARGGTRQPREREKFASIFNARYGSVVEFMDSDGEEGGSGTKKLFNRRPQWSQKNSNRRGVGQDGRSDGGGAAAAGGGGGVKVVGTMSRREFSFDSLKITRSFHSP